MKITIAGHDAEGTPDELAAFARLMNDSAPATPTPPPSRQTGEPVRYKGSTDPELTPAMLEVVELIRELGPMSPTQVGEYLDLNRGAANQRLIAAHQRGKLNRLGEGFYGLPGQVAPGAATLTAQQYATWELFKHSPEVSVTVASHRLNITATAASGRLRALVNAGLVRRARSGVYRRVVDFS
ncbi:helix-turn-helix DNA binding protein [Gordonia phage Yakult]|nr:helix-turn-helix DNA binding protein [Gordonia phage Yakult]